MGATQGHSSEIQEEPQTAKLSDIQETEPSGAAVSAGKPAAAGSDRGIVSKPAASPSNIQPVKFAKGDQVQLKDGTKAEITWMHPAMSIVRVKTADGRKLSLGARSLTKSETNLPVSVEPNGPQGQVVPGTGPGNNEQLYGGVSAGRTQGNNQPERTAEVLPRHPEVVTPKPAQQAVETAPIATKGQQLSTSADVSEQSEPANLVPSQQETAVQKAPGAPISKEGEVQPTSRVEEAVQPVGAKEPSPAEKGEKADWPTKAAAARQRAEATKTGGLNSTPGQRVLLNSPF